MNNYFHEKVLPRKNTIYKTVREISKVVTEILREVEIQEPRFISSLNEINGRFEGLTVVSSTEFEVGFPSSFAFELVVHSSGCVIFKSNGCIQFRRRWIHTWLCSFEIIRWSKTFHVTLGRIHHCQWLFVCTQNSFTFSNARCSSL